MKLCALVTTVASRDDALRLAHAAVERRLAACVQMEAIESVYRWRGQVQQESELRLLFKTTQEAAPALRRLILELHPYETPALYTLALADTPAAFTAWVAENSRGTGH